MDRKSFVSGEYIRHSIGSRVKFTDTAIASMIRHGDNKKEIAFFRDARGEILSLDGEKCRVKWDHGIGINGSSFELLGSLKDEKS